MSCWNQRPLDHQCNALWKRFPMHSHQEWTQPTDPDVGPHTQSCFITLFKTLLQTQNGADLSVLSAHPAPPGLFVYSWNVVVVHSLQDKSWCWSSVPLQFCSDNRFSEMLLHLSITTCCSDGCSGVTGVTGCTGCALEALRWKARKRSMTSVIRGRPELWRGRRRSRRRKRGERSQSVSIFYIHKYREETFCLTFHDFWSFRQNNGQKKHIYNTNKKEKNKLLHIWSCKQQLLKKNI